MGDNNEEEEVKPKLFRESRVDRKIQPPDWFTPESSEQRRSHFSWAINRTPVSSSRELSRSRSAENLTEYIRSPFHFTELPRRTPEHSSNTASYPVRPIPLEWDYSETIDLSRSQAFYNLTRLSRDKMGNEDTPPLNSSSHSSSHNPNPGPINPSPVPSPIPPSNLPLQHPILRTIHVPEKIDLFKGKRRPNDISFNEGPGLFDWLRTVDNYFNNTEIKEDNVIARFDDSVYCQYNGYRDDLADITSTIDNNG